MRTITLAAVLLSVSGCASMVPPDQMPITTEQREFTYQYEAPGKSQQELFRDARNFFAMSYDDVREVAKVEDETRGTIIGKAIAPWNLTNDSALIPFVPCASNYNIAFIAKDGKARLQLTLVEGAPLHSCGWTSPPKRDYPQIVEHFQRISKNLGDAINGNSSLDKLRNF